jgi:cytochrome c2
MKPEIRQVAVLFSGVILAASLGVVLAAPVTVQSPAGKAAEKTSEASAENGKKLYDRYCEVCHYTTTTAKKIGPGLKGIFQRGKFEDGSKVDDRSMRRWIEKGGKNMPAFGEDLKPQEIADLIAYLKTL